jgi:RecA-family ATPase
MAEILSEFMSRETSKIPHIIGRGVLPVKGKMIIFGDPKTNKSYVALNIGLALARGKNIFDATCRSGAVLLPVSEPYSVLYVEQEIGEDGLRERLKTMTAECGEVPFYIKTRDLDLRMDTRQGREAIHAEIEAVRPKVIILDPLAKFHLSDENSAQQMSAVMRVGDHWIEEFDIALIYIHHAGKETAFVSRKGGQRLRGSSALFGDADALVEVIRKSASHHKEPVLELNFELRRGEPLPPLYLKRLKTGICQWLGEDYHWGRPKKEPYADL